MNCPLCIDEVLDATHRHGIEIDICPRCKGIWLDRGELDRLLGDDPEPAGAVPAETPRRDDDRDRDRWRDDDRDRDRDRWRDDDRHRKKPKSKKKKLADLLEDILDL